MLAALHAHPAIGAAEPLGDDRRAHPLHVLAVLVDGVVPHPGLNLVMATVAGLVPAGTVSIGTRFFI